ncbi:hypothetical protein [Lacipirellula limnantheis]|uniref:Uncharacterized protein n=1 Tax=Lacipirellula limnantheis TaxID=2528024 RepID=A0A517TR85_9BACT|nr:hypothetical protein [Lacipirellula limnantheis]QDT70880.1 hypothetical protein I41_00330 [Lacipirellula limnantheis]
MTHPGRSRWQSIFALAALAAMVCAARPAVAQKALKPQIEKAQANALAGRVATILRDTNAPDPEETKVLDDFFMKYMYPAMTAYQPPEVLGQLATSREQLFTRYINTAKSQGARDYLNSKTLTAMGAIAKGPYHPSVRYNAALIVGQLDQTPGAPLPAATEVLAALLESDEFNKVPAPTALKIAAIIGLQRRVAGLEPAVSQRIAKAATAVALRKEAPEDASPEVYGWVRKNAAKLLTAQVATGMTPEVHQTMVTLISDKSIDLDDRCTIAQLLKPDMYKEAKGLDLDAMTIALGDLAKQVLTLEAKDAKKYEDELLQSGGAFAGGGGGGGFGMGRGEMGMRGGGFGAGMAMPEELGPTYERRRMIDRLLAIADGASAVAAGGSDESKAKLGELVAALRGVAEPAAEDKALLEKIAPAVQDLSVDVNKLVATWTPAAAAADEPAGGDFGDEAAAEPAADAPADAAEPAAADPAAVDGAASPAEPAGEPAAPPAEGTAPPAAEPVAEAPAAAAG